MRKITGAGETAPYRWQHPKDKGGTGGLIPYKHAIKLLSFAAENGIAVSASDFLDASDDPTQPAPEPTREVA